MKKVYTSAVVMIPPKDLWPPIQEIRTKYDRQVNKWMPHITLLYPFRSENEYELFEEDFTKICKKVTPFKVILKNFNFFQHQKQHYTIWIQPEPIESIINLQNLLLNVVPDCNDVNLHEFGFVPHLSVGQIIGKTQVISLLKELNQKWNELSFLLDNIFFIARKWVKNSKFEVKKQISLGKIIK